MKKFLLLIVAAASFAALTPAQAKQPAHFEDAPQFEKPTLAQFASFDFTGKKAFVIEAATPHEKLCDGEKTGEQSSLLKWFTLFGASAVFGLTNVRSLRDGNLSSTKALPAAAATNYSDAIDTAEVNPGRVPDVELLILLPATPSLVDAKTVTLTLQDSADNSTFAAVADVPAQVVTGAGGVGAAALSYQFKPPVGLRRYVRLKQDVLTAGGDNTAISSTLAFVF